MKGSLKVIAPTLMGLVALAMGALLIIGIRNSPKVVTSIRDLLSNPESYEAKLIQVEGFLSSHPFGIPHELKDDTGSISLIADGLDLDPYAGLWVKVEGRVDHVPNATGVPSVVVTDVSPIVGSPHLFVELAVTGGIGGLNDVTLVDNNGTVEAYRMGHIWWRVKINQERIEELQDIILDNDFLTQEQWDIVPKDGSADYFAYHAKIILQTQEGLKTNELAWIDNWASATEVPLNIVKFQQELTLFFRGVRAAMRDSLALEITIDRAEVGPGEIVTSTIKLTNVGQEEMTLETGLPVFDLILYDDLGRAVSRWSDGRAFIMIVRAIKLIPGQSYEEEIEWDLSRYDPHDGSYSPCHLGEYFLSALLRVKDIETVGVPIMVR